MHIFRNKVGLLLVLLLSAAAANADNDFGIGVKAGTLGLGLEISWQPLRYLDVRLGANSYDYENDGTQAGIYYDATLALESFYATANIHFPLSPMRISAGVYSNGNEWLMINDQAVDEAIGGLVYPGTGIGTITSTTSFASTAPYLGFGFDFTLAGKVGMNLDLGVLWQDEPIVSLDVSGPLATDPGFQASLELERQQLEDDMSDFKVWPVIQLGFVYKF